MRESIALVSLARNSVSACPNEPSDIPALHDALDGFDVLPGFSAPICEIFAETCAG